MSDDRISESPRCPVCATGYTNTPGASCPACGRVFSPPNSMTIPDLRLHLSDDGNSGLPRPASVVLGIITVVTIGFFAYLAYLAPGLLIPIAILLIPAVIRTIRLAALPAAHEMKSSLGFLFWALIVSFFISTLAGTAAAIVSGVVCSAIAVGGGGLDALGPGFIVGGIVGLGIFLLIFIKLWPRESEYDKIRRSPDPEN